jgi:hypothetical protein
MLKTKQEMQEELDFCLEEIARYEALIKDLSTQPYNLVYDNIEELKRELSMVSEDATLFSNSIDQMQ